MGNWRNFWYQDSPKTKTKQDYKIKCRPPGIGEGCNFLREEDQWVIQYADGNGIIRNVPKELAQEICRRWNNFEK